MRSHCCLYAFVLPTIARQRLGKLVPVSTTTYPINRRIVGIGVFYAVHAISVTKCAVK
jgi:hypothetical protein